MSEKHLRLGEIIRMARIEADMSQRDLADALGISQASVCKFEKGDFAPSILVALRLVELLGLDLEELRSEMSKP